MEGPWVCRWGAELRLREATGRQAITEAEALDRRGLADGTLAAERATWRRVSAELLELRERHGVEVAEEQAFAALWRTATLLRGEAAQRTDIDSQEREARQALLEAHWEELLAGLLAALGSCEERCALGEREAEGRWDVAAEEQSTLLALCLPPRLRGRLQWCCGNVCSSVSRKEKRKCLPSEWFRYVFYVERTAN